MATDKRISQLDQLTEAASNDLLAIVDTSEGDITKKTKKIEISDLMGAPGPIGTITPASGQFSSLQLPAGSSVVEFSTDGTLSGDSDTVLPTEQAVKTYVDTYVNYAILRDEATADITYYVDSTGSDVFGDGSIVNPFATIKHALSILPSDLNKHEITISLNDGVYNEGNITLSNRFTRGSISIISTNSDPTLVTINIPSGQPSISLNMEAASFYLLQFSIRVFDDGQPCITNTGIGGYVDSCNFGDDGNLNTIGIQSNWGTISVLACGDIDSDKVAYGLKPAGGIIVTSMGLQSTPVTPFGDQFVETGYSLGIVKDYSTTFIGDDWKINLKGNNIVVVTPIASTPNKLFIGGNAGFSITTGTDNVYLGNEAGYYNVTGSQNIAIGRQAGYGTNTYSGEGNVFIGYQAGYQIASGDYNVAIGYQAGYTLNGTGSYTADYNVLIGYQAGYSISGADDNVFIGRSAAYQVIGSTSGRNVVIGSLACYTSVGGSNNVVIGYNALYSGGIGSGFSSFIAIGSEAGHFMTSTLHSVIIGTSASYYNETGQYNTILGNFAAYGVSSNSYSNIVAIGLWSLYKITTADNTVSVGFQTLYNLSSGAANTAVGYQAGYYNETGAQNILIGQESGYGVTGNSYSDNIFIGYRSGFSTTVGGTNVAIGTQSSFYNLTGTGNLAVGYQAGYGQTTYSQSGNVFIGYQAGYTIGIGTYNVAVGYQSGYTMNGVASGGSSYNTLLGYQTGYSLTIGDNNVCIGKGSGYSLTSGASNIIIGYEAGNAIQTYDYNVLIGYWAGKSLTQSYYTIAMGFDALYTATAGADNTIAIGRQSFQTLNGVASQIAIGAYAGASLTSGTDNIFIGAGSGQQNVTGANNVVIGYQAGYGSANQSYSSNTILGYRSAYRLQIGASNVSIGCQAGYSNQTGGSNIFIGYQAGYNETGSNKLYISNSNTATPLILGDFSTEDLKLNADVLIYGSSRYLNFGTTLGTTGYGFRDNAGAMEYKNSGGEWQRFGITPSINNLEFSGSSFSGTVDQAFNWGTLVHKKSDQVWYASSASDSTAEDAISTAIYVGDSTSEHKFITLGFIRDDSWNWIPGCLLYMSATSGEITAAKPSISGEIVQVVGWAFSPNIIYFNPNMTLIEVS
jgi:hypothetical protein